VGHTAPPLLGESVMGLDMYLRAGRYVSNYSSPELTAEIHKLLEFPITAQGGTTVQVTCAYWRKSNQIHNWFVDNVQAGEDDCKPYYVGRKQLVELRTLCATVLEDVAGLTDKDEIATYCDENLPTQAGFFFGSYEYDEYYFDDLKSTIRQIDSVLTLSDEYDFEYQASW
jgi:hypothetical protein